MEMGSRKEDGIPISQEADDNSSTSASGQPIETALRAAGIYVRRTQRPLSSGINRNYHQDRYWSEMEARKSAVYYGHHEYDNPLTHDEIPPEEYVRSGSDASSSRYQTPRHYCGPVMDASSSRYQTPRHYGGPVMDASSSRYQTPRHYDGPVIHAPYGPVVHAPYGYPQHLDSSVSNMVVVSPPGHSTGIVYEELVHVPDYRWLSIFVLLFCCLPMGIFALTNAINVQKKIKLGRRQEALEQSKISRNLNIIAMVVGPILTTVIVLLRNYVFHWERSGW